MNTHIQSRPYVALLTLAGLLAAVGGLGYLGFVAFVQGLLQPKEFAAYGLVVTTLAAATASFFSPCSFTVLPSYLAFASGGGAEAPEGRAGPAFKTGAVAALGVMTTVAVLGALIGLLGTGIGADLAITGSDPSAAAQGLRYGIGAFVLALGLIHLSDQSHRIPFLDRIAVWATLARGDGGRSAKAVYAYGAGYVLVGVG